jgi:hypothetical protein
MLISRFWVGSRPGLGLGGMPPGFASEYECVPLTFLVI